MSATERLDQIAQRHSAWYDGDLGRAAWPDCTADEGADAADDTLAALLAARMIVRNDVPALIASLRAVLDLTRAWQPANMPREIRAAITSALDGAR